MNLSVDIRKTLRADAAAFELAVCFSSDSRSLVIHGPSGAGKSLTLQAIAGLLRPDEGHICLGGGTVFDASQNIHVAPQARRLAYVFQGYALFPHLNVRQNISFGLQMGWCNPRREPDAGAQSECVERCLHRFGLAQVASQYPHQLSGGQQQRTALARALITQPRALLLDEPFSALDASLRQRMRAELQALQADLDVPLILITHDEEDVRLFGMAQLEIQSGRIVTGQGAVCWGESAGIRPIGV